MMPSRKRGSKACSRCRRYRTKCVPQVPGGIAEGPCTSCVTLKVEHECIYVPRGQSAADRAHRRRPAPSVAPAPASTSSDTSPSVSAQPAADGLPPSAEVIEAIRHYVSSYFQLGFLHKAMFVERYIKHPESVSNFLILAICSIAAAFTPQLVNRYGGKRKATEFFLHKAAETMGQEMVEPSLERAQAFLLLGVSEWGQGNGSKAWMLVGTAVRMAGFLGLHRESSYQLLANSTPEAFIESEVARRTFWAITCHENLLAGQLRPMQISLAEVDVLLPCEESEFNFGIPPNARSSLAGTMCHSTEQGDRSLFASLVQTKILWSLIARHACRGSVQIQAWSQASQTLLVALQDFESSLPAKHRFSVANLRGMMVEGLDLAFLSIALITRLSHIVLRRLYLPSMASAIDAGATDSEFWRNMAEEMVTNSGHLLSQVETFFGMRSPQLGFPPIMVFGVYMCGNVFSYLLRWPELCLAYARDAESSFHRCVDILAQLADSWPLASRWHIALQSTSHRPSRQAGYSRMGPAAQEERNFDDDMADIYGRHSPTRTVAAVAPPQAEFVFNFDHADASPPEVQDDPMTFFLDTFGHDLTAFLQNAVPVDSGADDDFARFFSAT